MNQLTRLIRALAQTQRGSVTAEFAIAIPATMLALSICMFGLGSIVRQIQIQDLATSVARSTARGDVVATPISLSQAAIRISESGELVCAEVSMPVNFAVTSFQVFEVRASSCALNNGR